MSSWCYGENYSWRVNHRRSVLLIRKDYMFHLSVVSKRRIYYQSLPKFHLPIIRQSRVNPWIKPKYIEGGIRLFLAHRHVSLLFFCWNASRFPKMVFTATKMRIEIQRWEKLAENLGHIFALLTVGSLSEPYLKFIFPLAQPTWDKMLNPTIKYCLHWW